MATYRIGITDVTRYGALYCVAGWDIDDNMMIRPEPSSADPKFEASRFWDAQYAGPGKIFDVGNVVQFEAPLPPEAFRYPHATEDRVLKAGTEPSLVEKLNLKRLTEAVEESVSSSMQEIFDNQLVRATSGKAYVPADAQTRSLGAIEIEPSQIRFYEDVAGNGKRRLRAIINQENGGYDLSVPADAARARFLADGIDALQAEAKASASIHVRIGLCRPFPDMPDACYAQVNGLIFLK